MIQYEEYTFTVAEWILYLLEGVCIAGLLGWIFYHSFFAGFLLCSFLVIFLKKKKEQLMKKRKEELNLQFKDGIHAITASLTAGYSIENAFKEALKDLRMMYPEDAVIIREFLYIVKNLEVNVTVESLLAQLAARSGVEDIKSFADVFITAKRSGGDFISIIRMTSQNISQKIEVKREISVMVSAKKLEQKIMNVIPIFMILYISLSSKGFLDVMYQSLFGRVVMSICLFVYLVSYYFGNKIVEIEV